MMRKVVYISFVHLTEKYAHDWSIDYLIAKGVDVEFWNIVAITREKYTESHIKASNYSHELKSFSDLEARLNLPENRAAVYFMMVPGAAQFIRVLRLMSKYDCRMMYMAWGASPITTTRPSRQLLKHLGQPLQLAKRIFERLAMIVSMRSGLLKAIDTVFAAGEVLVKNQRFAARIVPINFIDYDNFMRLRAAESVVHDGPYAVFLDTNLPHQTDLRVLGLPALDPHNYYFSLNRFFDRVESQCGVKVVIAAHPKSNYDMDRFHGRACIRDLTPQLVKYAEFVITQTSSALSYAVLNFKPAIFVYTDDMLSLYTDTFMRQLHEISGYVDAPLGNIDRIADVSQIIIRPPNVERYECYKYDFLTTHESENTSTREIFFRELSTL